MQIDQVRTTANRIEQCADDAIKALQNANQSAPAELRECVSQMHEQARELRSEAQRSSDQAQLTGRVDRLEQIGDRAKEACRNAGSGVDPQLQSAVLRAHDEISSFKKQLH
jgi:sorbitol-specific phosphotransferase system component IIA